MKKIKLLIRLSLLLFFTSCYTYKVIPISDVMNSYNGQTEHEIIMRFGAPSATTADGAGGKILIYNQSQSTTLYNPYGYGSFDTYNTSYYMQYFINSGGYVYSWRTNYPNQIGNEKELNPGMTTLAVITVVGTVVLLIALASSGN